MNYAEARLSMGYDHRMQQLEMVEDLVGLIGHILYTMGKYSNSKQKKQIENIRFKLHDLHKQYEKEYMDYNNGIELLQGLKKENNNERFRTANKSQSFGFAYNRRL